MRCNSTSMGWRRSIDRARLELDAARRAGDLGRMSELQHGQIPQLEKQLEAASSNEADDTVLLRNRVSEDEIAEVVSKWTGIPVSRMLEGERDKLLRMEQELHERVVGQNEAVDAVANAIRRSRAGLSSPNKPYGSFLFLGPTGVGKTELSKALAQFLFDSEDSIVRVDMSEYMEKHSVSRLIGAPPGYVGYEVRRRPYSVILMDEVEKAHPDVFNILLQVLDDGRLTDGHGRTVDFKNTVIIMTSNLGSNVIQDLAADSSSDDAYERMKDAVMEIVGQHFRPEFINRIDETVVFHPLDKEQIASIAEVQLEYLAERLRDRDMDITFKPEAISTIAEVGFDPVYGARPLRRAIQTQIENPLAQAMLAGEFSTGDTIIVDIDSKGFVFTTAQQGVNAVA